MSDAAKQRVGERVAAWVEDGMVVGLGTGSTAVRAIEALGRRVAEESLRIVGVPTSYFAERAARGLGIPLATLDEVERVDLAFDGADEVSPALDLIKGRGAAHSREKVVASASDRFVVLVDESKLVDRLGTRFPVPVEVMPMALTPVMHAMERLGGHPSLRIGERKDGPVVSDQGFWIVDVAFDGIDDPAAMDRAIRSVPGVLDHGLFIGLATDVLVGRADGSVEHRTRGRVP
jgi:ribose 5-phosphate isomerase A